MKKSSFVFAFLFLFILLDLSAQQPMFGSTFKNTNVNREGMVSPFSSQIPSDIYQRRDVFHHSDINIKYQPRPEVSRPTHYKHDIVIGLQNQNRINQVALWQSSNEYYTRTPQKINLPVEQKVTYNSFPTINSKGEVVAEETTPESIVEIGPQQRLPGNWSEPGMPIGDFLLPMLLFVLIYISFRFLKGFNN